MRSAFVFLIKGSFWKQGFFLGFSLFLAADWFRNCYTGVNCLSSFSFLWSHFRHYGVFLSCLHLWTHLVLVWRWRLICLFLFALVRPMLFFGQTSGGGLVSLFELSISVWFSVPLQSPWSHMLCLWDVLTSMVSYAVSLGCFLQYVLAQIGLLTAKLEFHNRVS